MRLTLIPLFAALLVFTGCATTSTQTTQDPAKLDHAAQVVTDVLPYIEPIAKEAVQLALKYSEKDPSTREELRQQIFTVSTQLNALLSKGDFSPSSVTKALKVKEEYVNSILSGVSVAYQATYNKLQQNDSVSLAIQVLQALAKGVQDGTGEQ